MLKGRKVFERGETITPNYIFGPLEDDVIIKHRLLTRTTTTKGEPRLKKLQKKFASFVSKVEKNEDNCNDCDILFRAFLRELSTLEIPLHKRKVVIDANKVIMDLEKEIATLDVENTTGSRLLKLRKKHFALLLHMVDKLQTTIEEDEKNLIEEIRMTTNE
ncbi:unnamed protein product [Dovyalis caffra]|uniref:BAG domain-containing protein n=1 Tax=Dovyalis caffra TaxID=77055 RepID=A0AAV1S1I3_9ROSI|nr:unnamed protein product [Dovyalis caffra]